MSKMDTENLLVRDVIKKKKIIYLLIIFFLFLNQLSYSQLNSIYCIPNNDFNIYSACFKFRKTNVFHYKNWFEGNLNSEGKGTYILNKDSIILNYNKSEPLAISYHRLYTSKSPAKDSVKFNITLKNLKNKSLHNFSAFMNNKGKYMIKRTTNKQLSFSLKKEGRDSELKITINHFFKSYQFDIYTDLNYNIVVYMDDNNNRVIPIIDNIEKFKIIKNNDSLLYFRRYDNKIMKLVKKPSSSSKHSFFTE